MYRTGTSSVGRSKVVVFSILLTDVLECIRTLSSNNIQMACKLEITLNSIRNCN